jgi:hypothetical protein
VTSYRGENDFSHEKVASHMRKWLLTRESDFSHEKVTSHTTRERWYDEYLTHTAHDIYLQLKSLVIGRQRKTTARGHSVSMVFKDQFV